MITKETCLEDIILDVLKEFASDIDENRVHRGDGYAHVKFRTYDGHFRISVENQMDQVTALRELLRLVEKFREAYTLFSEYRH